MPMTRRRAAAAAPVLVDDDDGEEQEERTAAIDISSDSDAGSEASSEGDSESEEGDTSDEDFVDISDGESDSDSDADGGEGSGEGSEEEAEAGTEAETEQLGADRCEAACSKIAGLLRMGEDLHQLGGTNLEGIKLVECKAYLRKNGLSQTGDLTTCVDRIILDWRFKHGDPEKIYPRSSFCINCKGDVCRGDAVLFKQKVYEKSGKRHSKCIGKRIVAGKVIKESYGKEKQQHTFTVQVFWSKGAGKLPPLHLLLVKGRNLYRMMTFRQPWPNEAERLKALDEKHNRGDAARRVRASNRHNSTRNTLMGKKTIEKEKHQSRPGRSEHESNITKTKAGKKRAAQSSNLDLPNKRSRKDESQVRSGKGGWRAKKNGSHLNKNIHTRQRSSVCNDNREKDHSNLQRNNHMTPLNYVPSSTVVGMSKRKAGSWQKNSIDGSNSQFEGRCMRPASHAQANQGYLVGTQHPFLRLQRPPPLHEVGNIWQPHTGGSSLSCPNPPTMGFGHPNAALAGRHAPSYSRGIPPNQLGVPIPSSNMLQTMYLPHLDAAYRNPESRFPNFTNDFRR
ncbi:hypothetical protein ACP70R_005370 [Stipagrostis hirtigluma subsp. patula]